MNAIYNMKMFYRKYITKTSYIDLGAMRPFLFLNLEDSSG